MPKCRSKVKPSLFSVNIFYLIDYNNHNKQIIPAKHARYGPQQLSIHKTL